MIHKRLVIGSVLTIVGCILLACLGMGGAFLIDVPFNLAFGWVFYGFQTLPHVRFAGSDILTAAVCLTVFAAGLHSFLRWLYRHVSASRQIEGQAAIWPIRWTGALLGLILLMFVTGLAAVGISHQTAWLLTSPEPILHGSIREAAARMQSSNNLKQMALAMYNYQETKGSLPTAAVWSKEEQPLLSWRVLILPYLEYETLFEQFHLDEPWDSPHNLRLLPRMPKIYAPLSERSTAKPYSTHYQVFIGSGAAFEGRRGLRLPDDFPDGTANTILIVEASEAVPWTKPQDLPYSPGLPLPALGSLSPEFVQAVMVDGAVRQIKRDVRESVLRGLVTRNGEETPDFD